MRLGSRLLPGLQQEITRQDGRAQEGVEAASCIADQVDQLIAEEQAKLRAS
jgi:hypothetical protein